MSCSKMAFNPSESESPRRQRPEKMRSKHREDSLSETQSKENEDSEECSTSSGAILDPSCLGATGTVSSESDEETKKALHAELLLNLDKLKRQVDRIERTRNTDNDLNIIKERSDKTIADIQNFFRGQIDSLEQKHQDVLDHYAAKCNVKPVDLPDWTKKFDSLVADWYKALEESSHRSQQAHLVSTPASIHGFSYENLVLRSDNQQDPPGTSG